MTRSTRLFRRRDAASFLGISEDRLARLAVDGTGPEFHKPPGSRFCIYTESALLEWLGAPLRSTAAARSRDQLQAV